MFVIIGTYIQANDMENRITIQMAKEQLEREYNVSLEDFPVLRSSGHIPVQFEGEEEANIVLRTIEMSEHLED